MTPRTIGSSRNRHNGPGRPAGMPAWLHRITATVGALAIGLLSASVIVVGGTRPTEAFPPVQEPTSVPSGELARCGEHSDKAERHWCLARWTASAPAATRAGL